MSLGILYVMNPLHAASIRVMWLSKSQDITNGYIIRQQTSDAFVITGGLIYSEEHRETVLLSLIKILRLTIQDIEGEYISRLCTAFANEHRIGEELLRIWRVKCDIGQSKWSY